MWLVRLHSLSHRRTGDYKRGPPQPWRLMNASRDKKCASSSVFSNVEVVGERMAMILLHSIASLISPYH